LTAGIARNPDAARAVSRCCGALFFAVFGGAWLLLASYAFGRLSKFEGVLIAAVVVLFILAAAWPGSRFFRCSWCSRASAMRIWVGSGFSCRSGRRGIGALG